ncbi:MAG: enoyl-CoA hydratase-related protein [Peptoniphilus sp.]|nr:enoyl-CoA hydratase-related protein [Peptoniphilus sp.]MDD7363473.1 enoyl-CoA hydratase-related protein [Bacillota bacterium]MDY6044823.1 enoyl-CoA hydratase-related protein [Peptoniphilus sp.]
MIYLNIENSIATVTFDRPETMNALNSESISELRTIIDEIEEKDVHAIIFTGAGKAFIAGADTKEMEHLRGMEIKNFSEKGQQLFRRIEKLPIPTIAAINGYAFGGGLELALACDLRLASKKARFAFPETTIGITPGFSGTQRLPRAIGRMNALYMFLTGEVINAERAKEFGLVLSVEEPDALMNKAMSLAQVIVKNSKTACSLILSTVDAGLDMSLDGSIDFECAASANIFGTYDQIEGMAALREKRKPHFK